jgi:hypothetical protein
MDIFTTYLTKVVSRPIKPTNLKVKALAKDASSSELTDDLNHLENHDNYYQDESNDNRSDKDQGKEPEQLLNDVNSGNEELNDKEVNEDIDHLDLYV